MKTRTDVELLAELEKEVADLQTTIAVLKRRMGGSANGSQVVTNFAAITAPETNGHDKPYLGMSIPEAAKKYLQRVREPKSPQEISEALRRGGLHSRSSDFMGVMRTTLARKGKEFGIESFGPGKWGLSDWRPSRGKGGAIEEPTEN